MRFLTLFCADVRTISYQGARDEHVWTKKVFSALGPGRKVGFVTRGHPLISGSLANELLRRARREKVQVVNLPSVSTVDSIVAMGEELLSVTSMGLQVYDSRLVVEKRVALQDGLPMILYLGLRRGRDLASRLKPYAAALQARLVSAYGARHKVFLHGPRYDVRAMEELRLSGLAERLLREQALMLASLILFVPPARVLKPKKY
jgi:hypothetical protein